MFLNGHVFWCVMFKKADHCEICDSDDATMSLNRVTVHSSIFICWHVGCWFMSTIHCGSFAHSVCPMVCDMYFLIICSSTQAPNHFGARLMSFRWASVVCVVDAGRSRSLNSGGLCGPWGCSRRQRGWPIVRTSTLRAEFVNWTKNARNSMRTSLLGAWSGGGKRTDTVFNSIPSELCRLLKVIDNLFSNC